jgi:hypothetical protein
MQVLVAHNLLVHQQITRRNNIEVLTDDYFALANARVVLPAKLFEKDKVVAPTAAAPTANAGQSVVDSKQQALTQANGLITALEKAKVEITKQSKQFQKDYDKNYKLATEKYEEETAPIFNEYNRQLAAERDQLCKNPPVENSNSFCNEPKTEYPLFPKFNFTFDAPIANLSKDISPESFRTIQEINALKNADTYQEIIANIDAQIEAQYTKTTENTVFEQQVLMAGGVAIPLVEKITLPYNPTMISDGAFVPEKFGVRQIGIADYKKVVAHVCCYDAGEVSHIENIMAKEMRSKTTTRERIEEFTQTTETQQEREALTDTTTSERFEMQTEVSKLLQEQRQFEAHASLSGGNGVVHFEVGANYATNTSKEESNRQAVTQAKDITQKASERIVTKMRNEIIRKTTERFKEENDHVYDNRLGEKHVSGVYRFINAIYKNQVYIYGKRMMYEFMIPQPSKLHRLGMLENQNNAVSTAIINKPIDPRTIGLYSSASLNDYNYKAWAAQYGAQVKTCPEMYKTVGDAFDFNTNEEFKTNTKSKKIQIPDGYYSETAQASLFGMGVGNNLWSKSVILSIGDTVFYSVPGRVEIFAERYIKNYTQEIPISFTSCHFYTANATATVKCRRSAEFFQTWQDETYNAIIKAYEEKLSAYNASLTQNDTSFGTNPGFYRQIEQLVMRKNCISYLMDEAKMGQGFYNGTTLTNYSLQQTQEMDNYASYAKFMEQAFEWNLISYNFYPFYWGKRTDWPSLYQYECNDPLFRSFMQAGMARVIVTVKPGFENAVMHFMATGQIWNGGQVPVLDNPLYLSIVDELKEQEYVINETWETVVPTSLVALQSSGVAINAEGLPCGDDCIDHAAGTLINNNNTISGK